MVDEKMGAINGGTKVRNGETIKYGSLESFAKSLAVNVINNVIDSIENNQEDNLEYDESGNLLNVVPIFSISIEKLKEAGTYNDAFNFDNLNVFLSFEKDSDTLASFNPISKEFVFSFYFIKEMLEKYGDNQDEVLYHIVPTVIHELTHMVNAKSFEPNISVNQRLFDNDINDIASGIFYLFMRTEMNARVSEFWERLKDFSYGKVKQKFGTDTNIANGVIDILEDAVCYKKMLFLIEKLEETDVKGVGPNSRDNLLIAILKSAHGRTFGKIKFPSLSYVFGTNTKTSDKEYSKKMFDAANNGNIMDFFSQDNRNNFNDFGKGKLTQEYAEERLEEVKVKLVSQLKSVANTFYKRLCKVVSMWIDYRKKIQAKRVMQMLSQQLRENDIHFMVNESVKKILNEISSSDAWERFYKDSMSPDDYERIIMGQPNIDKFIQMFLNFVRDEDITADEAVSILEKYNNADEKIKARIKANFNNGELTSPIDVEENIDIIEKTGIVSKKEWAKKGYIKVEENEDWIVTTTTNYEASKHYFHDTPWCTASDEGGQYNGYEMFMGYAVNQNASLVQFVSKKLKDDDKNKKIQVQLFSDGLTGDINDLKHNSVYFDEFVKIVGSDLWEKIKSYAPKLSELTQNAAEKEKAIHEVSAKAIYRKKEINRKKEERERAKLEAKIIENNEKIDNILNKKWNEIVENGLLTDRDFLENTIHDSRLYDEELDNLFRSDFNAYINTGCLSKETQEENGVKIYYIRQTMGVVYNVVRDNNNNLKIRANSTTMSTNRERYHRAIVVQIEDSIELLGTSSNYNYDCIARNLSPSNWDYDTKKLTFLYSLSIDNKNFIVDCTHKKIYRDVPFPVWTRRDCGNLFFLLDREARKVWGLDGFSGNIFENGDKISEFTYKGNVTSYLKDGKRLVYISKNEQPTILTYFPKDMLPYDTTDFFIGWKNNNEQFNASPIEAPYDLIFGKWFDDIDFISDDDGEGIRMTLLDDDGRWKKEVYYNGAEKSFVSRTRIGRSGYPSKWEKCDNIGVTEKEKISQKNFDDWVAKGGHSKEALDQMDKMWADRRESGDNKYVDDETYEKDRLGKDYWAAKNANNSFIQDLIGQELGLSAPKVSSDEEGKKYGMEPHKDWRGYYRTSSDIDAPIDSPVNAANGEPYKHKFKNVRIDKDGKDIPDWSEDDEMAVARRNQQARKEMGLDENDISKMVSEAIRKILYSK